MAIKSSGPLYLSEIHNEFQLGYSLGAHRNIAWHVSGGSGQFPAANIAMSQFLGKSKNPLVATIGVYGSVDDSAILYPTNSAGQIIGAGQGIGSAYADKVYHAAFQYFTGFVPENGYYYFRIDVTNAGSSTNAGVCVYWPDGTSCELVANLANSFTFYPNGFTRDGWTHPGPWWRFSNSYNNASGLFRLVVR